MSIHPKRSDQVRPLILIPILLLAMGLFGCGEEDPTDPRLTLEETGVIRGELDGSMGSFEIRSDPGSDPLRPVRGPFIIRGDNIHYDDVKNELLVDLSVENGSDSSYPNPVALTFVSLLPDGIKVLNSINDHMGAGAMIKFEFENDDLQWTPGEESFPTTVQFLVEQGVSIGFVARIDVGMDPNLGSIGGMVWNDANGDGVMDEDEGGLGGVRLRLMADGMEPRDVGSAPDGSYRFDNLSAGFYNVRKMSQDGLRPTTPVELSVVLVDNEGEVSDFLSANFGCMVLDDGGGDRLIEPGDRVSVNGEYASDPDRIIARSIEVDHHFDPDRTSKDDDDCEGEDCDDDCEDCDDDCEDCDDDCEGEDHGDDCPGDWDGIRHLIGDLRGPVTDISIDRGALAIMGTWIAVARTDEVEKDDDHGDHEHDRPGGFLDLEDVAIGDRVRVRVLLLPDTPEDEALRGFHLREWNGTPEKVKGIVEEVRYGDAGDLNGVRVLRTWVEVTPDTDIDFDD